MSDDFVLPLGIELIGEMTKDALIDELVAQWREELSTQDLTYIKKAVIALRMSKIRERMIKEAGLTERPGFLGFPTIVEDE